jgi:hypothetical protein
VGPPRHARPLSAARRLVALAAGVGAAGLIPACLTIDGGAIELSWVTYCASGTKPGGAGASCSCNERAAGLATVQLVLNALGDAGGSDVCAGRESCRFAAGRQSGNTGFFVPPGDYELTLVPLDASGQALGGPSCVPDGSANSCWQTPAPLRRTVLMGEVVSLGSFLIAVPDCPATTSCAATETCP